MSEWDEVREKVAKERAAARREEEIEKSLAEKATLNPLNLKFGRQTRDEIRDLRFRVCELERILYKTLRQLDQHNHNHPSAVDSLTDHNIQVLRRQMEDNGVVK